MTATAALELYRLLDAAGVRCWVIGGWGIDALVGRMTRSHHDLDLLVHRDDVAAYDAAVRSVDSSARSSGTRTARSPWPRACTTRRTSISTPTGDRSTCTWSTSMPPAW